MSEKKSNNSLQGGLVVGIFLVLIILLVRNCNKKSEPITYEEEEVPTATSVLDSLQRIADSIALVKKQEAIAEKAKKAAFEEEEKEYTNLYVTFPNLNVRSTPQLKGKLIERLKLYDKVLFMNEVTDTTQRINLGDVVANEPWIKIKTPTGNEGWVYGAGVSYYKKKVEGVKE